MPDRIIEPVKSIVVSRGGERIDVWLRGQDVMHGLSRRKAAKAVESGQVNVDGKPVRKGFVVESGQTVSFPETLMNRHLSLMPEARPWLQVRYEDSHLVVVEKPSGMHSVPHESGELGCAANHIAGLFPQCIGIGRWNDAGLIQRLDYETSGLLIVAKSADAHVALKQLQTNKHIQKVYQALVSQWLEPGYRINDTLERATRQTVRVVTGGIVAETQVLDATPKGDFTLLEVEILTGFRHQIRVHLSSVGAAICGDYLYGGNDAAVFSRLFLHASRLSFPHPMIPSRQVDVVAPLPPELEQILFTVQNPPNNH